MEPITPVPGPTQTEWLKRKLDATGENWAALDVLC